MEDRNETLKWLVLGALISVGTLALIGQSSEQVNAKPCRPGNSCPYPLVEAIDLPYDWRERNYAGGSCVHASMVMVLRWQGHHELADWWREAYSGGEYDSGLINKAERAGLRYAYTLQADVRFLDWCSRTRRGAVIFYFPAHSIVFCGFDDNGDAVLLDNNRIDHYITVPRDQFIREWEGYGGFAFTPVYDPPPRRPWI